MASKKFTDLPVATSADAGDIIAIVDVSTDTSKQITKDDFIGIALTSDTFLPTPANLIALDDVEVSAGWFMRVGNKVLMFVLLDTDFSTGEASGIFDIDLPVPSNFANARQAFAVSNNSTTGQCLTVLASSSAANTITITVVGNATDIAIQSLSIWITYDVV